jgi:thiamine biosynthesis lipoprotein
MTQAAQAPSAQRSHGLASTRTALGTYVTVSCVVQCRGANAAIRAARAIEQAFSAIALVEQIMSLYRADSDVSRINRMAADTAAQRISVHPWTREVLQLAQSLQRDSNGLFDCGIAPTLMQWGLLPAGSDATRSSATSAVVSSISKLRLHEDGTLSLLAPTVIDLGGIAKGYAVDRAIDAMRQAGASEGSVNAGGDLRQFGGAPQLLQVRDPLQPSQLHPAGWLRDGAMATSSIVYSRRRVDCADGGHRARRTVSSIVHPASLQPMLKRRSYSVIAPLCVHADALTKVLALIDDETRARDLPCFVRHQAQPLIVQPQLSSEPVA